MVPIKVPEYGKNTIAEIFTSAAAVLGVKEYNNTLNFPDFRRICVVVVDGMGLTLLQKRIGHIPFLRKTVQRSDSLLSTFPSTTVTAMTSLGTGLSAGKHGICGYEILDPNRNVIVNQLSNWQTEIDPKIWQPYSTVFEKLSAIDVPSFMVSLPKFRNSSLSNAAFRGINYFGSYDAKSRVENVLEVLKKSANSLTYLYWSELDKIGHRYGCDSNAWVAELEKVDDAMEILARRMPADTLLVVTADHGMVDVAANRRVDYSLEKELVENVVHTGGEPRVVQIYTKPGYEVEVAKAWLCRYGDFAWVYTKAQALEAKWFGDVDVSVLPRIGDVIVAAFAEVAFYDLRRSSKNSLQMVGQHGSFTAAEQEIPCLLIAK